MSVRIFLLGFSLISLLILPCYSQYSGLTTDYTGSRLVFSAPHSLRTEARNDDPKLYELSSAGVLRTLSSTLRTVETPLLASNFSILSSPELSSDGSALVWTAKRWCQGERCAAPNIHYSLARFDNLSATADLPGIPRLSANARWLLLYDAAPPSTYRWRRYDLSSGTYSDSRVTPSSLAPTGRRVIANDGTFAYLSTPDTLTVDRPGQSALALPLAAPIDSLTISNDASFAVARAATGALVAVDLSTATLVPLLECPEGASQPALSDDSTSLLFLSAANFLATNPHATTQLWTLDLLSGHLAQWTADPQGIAEATLSGDGLVAWALTTDGRILRVERDAAPVELLERAPWLSPVPGHYAYGAWVAPTLALGAPSLWPGSGLLDSVLHWQDSDLKPLLPSSSRLSIRLPFTAPLTTAEATLENPLSRFQPQLFSLTSVAYQPQWFDATSVDSLFLQPAGFRADGSPISASNRPAAGESVSLFLSGLGEPGSSGSPALTSTLNIWDAMYDHAWIGRQVFQTSPKEPLSDYTITADPTLPGRYLLRFRIPDRDLYTYLGLDLSLSIGTLPTTYLPVAGRNRTSGSAQP